MGVENLTGLDWFSLGSLTVLGLVACFWFMRDEED